MVEEQQAVVLKDSIKECYEVVVFEAGMESWLKENIENLLRSEATALTCWEVT